MDLSPWVDLGVKWQQAKSPESSEGNPGGDEDTGEILSDKCKRYVVLFYNVFLLY